MRLRPRTRIITGNPVGVVAGAEGGVDLGVGGNIRGDGAVAGEGGEANGIKHS